MTTGCSGRATTVRAALLHHRLPSPFQRAIGILGNLAILGFPVAILMGIAG